MKKLNKNDKHRIFLLIGSLIFLSISLTFLYFDRNQSYYKYERIQFESGNAILYANLYYPVKQLSFQKKHPLIISAHGLGSQRDLDLRIPVEFTKRGFFVATIDYQGHGESGGHLLNIDPKTGIPALAEDCSNLLNMIEKMPVFNRFINSSQIGLFGHSLGGMVALISGALDDRFSVTVAWSAPVWIDLNRLDISNDHIFYDYMPIHLINKTHPKNLLIIHHIHDEVVPFTQNALVIKNLTSCKLIRINESLLFGGHSLLSDYALEKTINWYELKFFNSTTINGPIHFSYLINYILIGISLSAIFLTTLSIIFFSAKYFLIFKERQDLNIKQYNIIRGKRTIKKIKKRKSCYIIKIFGFSFAFIFIWFLFEVLFGLSGLFIAPSIIIALYFIFNIKRIIIWFKQEEMYYKLKHQLICQCEKYVLAYSFLSIGIFLALYMIFSITYPFAFFFPSNPIYYLFTFTIYPFYLSFEIFYRKVIYPLFSFLKSYKTKTIIIILLIIFNQAIIMILTSQLFLVAAIFATFLISLTVMILNTLIYEKTGKISSVLISSFIIIQIFFGSAVSTVFGIGSILRLFVRF
ncbi:MAG: alpha/beta hydrolase family protein [Promethearchaeota archaeon]